MTGMSTSRSRYISNFVKVAAGGSCLAILLVACQKPEQKVENAKVEVANATQDLKEAKREMRTGWQEDWLNFKRDNDKVIAENERHIIDFRKEVSDIDAPYRAKYSVRIDAFEQRNNDLRDRVNNCKDEGDVSWEAFKKDVKRETDDLNATRKDITIKNS
jgi:hypothetical protein